MSNETAPPKPFPLEWPITWPRTEPGRRHYSKYKVDHSQARDDLLAEMRRLSARFVVISSNVPVRLSDGAPLANYREPDDPGVAAYWEDDKRVRRVVACDRWRTLRENMRAVTLAIAAIRALERSGAGQVMDRMFAGLALPENAGASSERPWWDVLGIRRLATPTEIKVAYRELARIKHPDQGGTIEDWHELNRAYAAALPSSEARP